MKKIFIALFVFIVAVWTFYSWNTIPNEMYIGEISQIKPEEENQVEQTVLNINKRSNLIRNFSCNVEIQIDDGKRTYRLRAELDYEKPIRFRMKSRSMMGVESDLGSNDDLFWFWSKRMNPPALHYAMHEDLYKTRLKTPFNPLWIMESLSLGKIAEDAQLFKTDRYWVITEKRVSTMGRLVDKMTLIDPENERIMGHYLFEQKRMVASTEVKNWIKLGGVDVPQKLVIIWHDEDVKLSLDFVGVKINTSIDPKKWEIPNKSYKIDMGNGDVPRGKPRGFPSSLTPTCSL